MVVDRGALLVGTLSGYNQESLTVRHLLLFSVGAFLLADNREYIKIQESL